MDSCDAGPENCDFPPPTFSTACSRRKMAVRPRTAEAVASCDGLRLPRGATRSRRFGLRVTRSAAVGSSHERNPARRICEPQGPPPNGHGASAYPFKGSRCPRGRSPHLSHLREGGGDAVRAARKFHGNQGWTCTQLLPPRQGDRTRSANPAAAMLGGCWLGKQRDAGGRGNLPDGAGVSRFAAAPSRLEGARLRVLLSDVEG